MQLQGVSTKTQKKFNRLSCIINVAKQFNFYIWRKNCYSYLAKFSMVLFLNCNDEKWPHTHQIKIASQKHILPPWELHGKWNIDPKRELKLNVKLSKIMHESIPGVYNPPPQKKNTPGNLPDRQFTGVRNLPVLYVHWGRVLLWYCRDPGDLTNGFTFAKIITCAMRI